MMLLVILLTMTVQTAWADGNPFAEYPGTGDLTITEPGTYDASGHIYGNLIINTSDEVILNVGNLTVQGNLQLEGGTLTLYVHDGSHINAQIIPMVNTLNMDGGEITCSSIGFESGTVSGGTINAYHISAAGTISGGTLTATNRFIAGVYKNPTAYYLTISGGIISAPTIDILTETTINVTDPNFSIAADTYKNSWSRVLTISGRSLIDEVGYVYAAGEVDLSAIAGKTLRPAYTVTFDENGGSDVSDLTVAGGSTISDPGSTKTGYTATWKEGGVEYDFTAKVENDLTLTAHWAANTYTVHFDANGGSGEMADMNLTYDGDYATLTAFGFTAPEGKAFKNWNTADDGSGASYDNEEWVRNLTTENGATVTLYAQWGKDISTCTAEVPNQSQKYTHDEYEINRDLIWYKFDDANNYADVASQTGVVVKDGNTPLTLGTDYRFHSVRYDDGTAEGLFGDPEKVGDKCLLVIEGMGNYAGKLYAPFRIIVSDDNGTSGDLKWVYSDGTLTISKKDDVEGNVAMPDGNNYDDFDWKEVASGVFTLTIDEGITKVGNFAFGSKDGVEHYGNLTTINLPNSLTEIGENAFAYCVGLSIDLADLNGIEYPASAFSYIGSITGTLDDKADNRKAVTMMWQAGTNNVTITDRTLYKDGYWNTICLPFDVKADNALLTGATVKELDLNGYYDDKRTGFDEQSGSLYLFFQTPTADGNGVLLKAGTPYLIKWPSGENSTSDLTFNGVKVISSPLNITSKDNKVSFIGNFSPVTLKGGDDETDLYLGGNNKLYWPSSDKPMNSFRAYFHVDLSNPSGGGQAPELKIVLNFGEDENTTAINEHESHESHELSGAWYSLDGRKLDGKPTQKGLYIVNGKKVVIK